jgi:superfamily II DNA or RNA helicase
MKLRPYQNECVTRVFSDWDSGSNRCLAVLCTGAGKTIIASAVANIVKQQGGKLLFLAHRSELLTQAQDKFLRACGLESGLEKAESCAHGHDIIVGSVQSLTREKRLEKFGKDYFSHIIVDECHHSMSDSYLRVLDYFDSAKVLGITATPDRADKKNIGKVFDSLSYEYDIRKAVKEGFLVRPIAKTIPLEIDISGINMKGGDFDEEEVAQRLEAMMGEIADKIIEYAHDKKCAIFTPLIRTSKALEQIMKDKGYANVIEVNGASPDRKERLQKFESMQAPCAIVNSMLLTEGWDDPTVDCIINLRPTKSRSLYVQIIGRGLRLNPPLKKECLILDFLWQTQEHDLCRPIHLVSPSKEIADKVKQAEDPQMVQMDLIEAEELAEQVIVHERETAMAAKLAEQRKKKGKLVDLLQFSQSVAAEDLIDYEPCTIKELSPPTPKQIAALESYGIATQDIKNFGLASKLIERMIERRKQGLTSPKQIRLLERYKFQQVGSWKQEEAGRIITRLAECNYVLPAHFNPRTYKPKSLLGSP